MNSNGILEKPRALFRRSSRGDVVASSSPAPGAKQTQRRGARAAHLVVDELEIASPPPDDQLLALNDALDRFAGLEPQQAELLKLRYFVGLKTEEAAQVLGVSNATAERWWTYARAWLFHETRADSSGIRPAGEA